MCVELISKYFLLFGSHHQSRRRSIHRILDFEALGTVRFGYVSAGIGKAIDRHDGVCRLPLFQASTETLGETIAWV
jgi:hypothetical protein